MSAFRPGPNVRFRPKADIGNVRLSAEARLSVFPSGNQIVRKLRPPLADPDNCAVPATPSESGQSTPRSCMPRHPHDTAYLGAHC